MQSITICCSKRFLKEERAFAKKLRSLGCIVFEPPLSTSKHWETLTEEEKVALASGLTLRHFEKIQKAEAIFVLNKNGYIGVSTNLEIGYAAALHKRIFFLEEDDDYPRKVLAEHVARTPAELLTKLKSPVSGPMEPGHIHRQAIGIISPCRWPKRKWAA